MNTMGFLDRFRVQTPRPNLMGAVTEIETAMHRLQSSTDELEGLLERMGTEVTDECLLAEGERARGHTP